MNLQHRDLAWEQHSRGVSLQVRAKGALPSVARILTSSVAAAFCASGAMCTRTKPSWLSWRGILRSPMAADLKEGGGGAG